MQDNHCIRGMDCQREKTMLEEDTLEKVICAVPTIRYPAIEGENPPYAYRQ